MGQKSRRGNLTIFSDFLCVGVKNSEPENADDRIIGYWWAPRAAATVCTDRKISWRCMMSALICFTNRRKHPSCAGSGTRDNYPATKEQGSGWSAQPRDRCLLLSLLLPLYCYGENTCNKAACYVLWVVGLQCRAKSFFHQIKLCLFKNEKQFPGI